MKRITVDHGEGKNIAKKFKTTPQLVVRALRFGSDSELAKRIRKHALNNGGILFESSEAPVKQKVKII